MKNKKNKYTIDKIINNPHLLLGKFEYYFVSKNTDCFYMLNYFYKIDKECFYIFAKTVYKDKKSKFILNTISIKFLKEWFNCEDIELF